MKHVSMVALLSGCVLVAGCATHISVMETHREDLSSQTKKLAIAARNLEETTHHNAADVATEEAARAVVQFHNDTENFARIASAWRSTEQVNDQYEQLVKSWVKLKHTFPSLKADSIAQDAYKRVEYEWEHTSRAAGHADRKYEKEIEDKYSGEGK